LIIASYYQLDVYFKISAMRIEILIQDFQRNAV